MISAGDPAQPSGRAALLVGAASATTAVAHTLEDAGFAVVMAGADVVPQSPGRTSMSADPSDAEDIGRVFASVTDALGAVDLVVFAASAAVGSRVTASADDWAEAWTSALTLDVLGAATVLHAAVAHFRSRPGGGRLVLLVPGPAGSGGQAALPAAVSGALTGLAAGMAAECRGQGVDVVVISGAAAEPGDAPIASALARAVGLLSGPLGSGGLTTFSL